jgi:hypothetical protein
MAIAAGELALAYRVRERLLELAALRDVAGEADVGLRAAREHGVGEFKFN